MSLRWYCSSLEHSVHFLCVCLCVQASAISLRYSGAYDSLTPKGYQEIPRADIELQTRVGGNQDQFGEVYKGLLQTATGTVMVTLKIIQSTASAQERATALKEAEVIGRLEHPHIVKLYGVVTEGEPVSSLWAHYQLLKLNYVQFILMYSTVVKHFSSAKDFPVDFYFPFAADAGVRVPPWW